MLLFLKNFNYILFLKYYALLNLFMYCVKKKKKKMFIKYFSPSYVLLHEGIVLFNIFL